MVCCGSEELLVSDHILSDGCVICAIWQSINQLNLWPCERQCSLCFVCCCIRPLHNSRQAENIQLFIIHLASTHIAWLSYVYYILKWFGFLELSVLLSKARDCIDCGVMRRGVAAGDMAELVSCACASWRARERHAHGEHRTTSLTIIVTSVTDCVSGTLLAFVRAAYLEPA